MSRPERSILKRVIDKSVATSALIACSPVLAAIFVGVRLSLGAPSLFRQTRAGQNGRPFVLWKFRTMVEPTAGTASASDDERLTAFGRFLRSSSLDELPQLWNVVRGDMSLVGPRPLLLQYGDRYDAEQSRRLEVKPGITGWAQIKGRNSLSWEEKFRLDVWYIDNWSLLLDARIIALTVLRVLERSGVSNPGHATMPEFMGSGNARR